MVFISIFIILLLTGITLWLWRLSRTKVVHRAVDFTIHVAGSQVTHATPTASAAELQSREQERYQRTARKEPEGSKQQDAQAAQKLCFSESENSEQNNIFAPGLSMTREDVAKEMLDFIDYLNELRKIAIQYRYDYRGGNSSDKFHSLRVILKAKKERIRYELEKLRFYIGEEYEDYGRLLKEEYKVEEELEHLAHDPHWNSEELVYLAENLITFLTSSPLYKEVVTSEGSAISEKLPTPAEEVITPCTVEYAGEARYPKEILAGNSENVSLILDRKSFIQGLSPEVIHTEETAAGKQVTLDIQIEDNRKQSLEVQLMAKGFTFTGPEKQLQSLSKERLEYRWNCLYKEAGCYNYSLVLKVISPFGERNLPTIDQTVHVRHLDHMSQQHVRIAKIGTGTLTLLLIIANLLATVLGIWHIH